MSEADKPQITILIPTMDRPDFLVRLLDYYAAAQYRHWIYIGDSSSGVHALQIQGAIKKFEGRLKVKYYACPHLNDSQTIKALIDAVETPYAVFLADDDFLVPNGLEQCIHFLEQHPDYSAAHGQAVLFTLTKSGAHGEFAAVSAYPQPSLEADSGGKRLMSHFQRYSVSLFSVHRTETWKRMYRSVPLVKDKAFTEILPCGLSVIFGKIKALNGLYLVRQGHDHRYVLPDAYDWLTETHWSGSQQMVCGCLAQELAATDQIDLESAKTIVKWAFWSYLNTALVGKYQSSYGPKRNLKEYKNRIKNIPWLGDAARRVKSKIVFPGQVHLATMLNKRSEFYQDFLPVYRIVAGLGGAA